MFGHFKRLTLVVCLAIALFAVPARAELRTQINSYATVRSAAVLTTSYVATTAVETHFSNQVLCFVDFTIGSLTSAEIVAQYGHTSTGTFYDETILNTAAGSTSSDEFISPLRVKVYQMSATGTKAIAIPALARFVRLKIKGTGTVTNSSATIACYAGAI